MFYNTLVDIDGNGEIDYDEFLLLVCRRILREKAHEGNDLTSVESAIREIVRMIKTVKNSTRLSDHNNRSDWSMVPYKRNDCNLAPILRSHEKCTTLTQVKCTNGYTNPKALIEAPCKQILQFA